MTGPGDLAYAGPTAAAHPIASPRQRLQDQLAAPLPESPELVLVTDLDGTLLEGEREERRRFYAWLASCRQQVLHVFSTGRSLESIAEVLEQDEPTYLHPPHLVIGDVGCTVACGRSLQPLPLALEPIEARWQGLQERLEPLLQGQPGLTLQPRATNRRLAYLVDVEVFDRALIPRLEAAGADCVLSGDRYFDVLPPGVNKGSTLLALLEWLELDGRQVVTAGDSLNDLAMFETGLAGVMVGNAEPDLVAALPRLPSVYRARAEGCAGIAEGLVHFGYGHLLSGGGGW